MSAQAGELLFMRRALELAKRGLGHTRPNPAVGAVVAKDGKIIGEGYHHKCGGAHAEVEAIADARKNGCDTRGATIYVTLEPCSKPGRVGACTDAIAASGIAEAVYAASDPNEKNRGKACAALAPRGIKCRELERTDESAALIDECNGLIKAFRKHVTTGLPFLTVKIAMSLDGKICDDNGDAKWISSENARQETGKLREIADAIMVGAETLRKDDPSLLSHGEPNDDLVRVIVTKSGNLPRTAQVFADGKNKTLVMQPQAEEQDVDFLRRMMRELGEMGFTHVLCEGGLELARGLAAAGLVDEWISVIAPIVIGHAPIGEAKRFALEESRKIRGSENEILARYRCLQD